MEYAIIGFSAFLILLVFSILQSRRKKAEIEELIKNSFGKCPEEKYTALKLEALQEYFKAHKGEKAGSYIDDITWHDLDMERVFMLINNTQSALGEEYLYYLLRTPELSQEILDKRSELINFFSTNRTAREDVQKELFKVGKLRNISIYEYMNKLHELEEESNTGHFIQAALLLISLASIFIYPSFGIIAFVVMVSVNFMTYFRRKSEIENFFYAVSFIIRWLDAADDISKLDIPELSEYFQRMQEMGRDLRVIRRGATVVTSKSTGGDPIQALGDYVRMALHMDLIRFNNMHKAFKDKTESFEELFEIFGLLDSMIAAASFREMIGDYCEPVLSDESRSFEAKDIYHPLLDEPVSNSIDTNRPCLITGSNASGKSTFIKACAINAILAQSIYTVCAARYSAAFFRVMSSMALSDDILGGESYYVVEIRSLKRILDAMTDDKLTPVLCFIDEVLRGTNTLERIGASATILRRLADGNGIAFAATHDIELTYILEDHYDNYHFEEQITGDKVCFDYSLREGRSGTRNAIRLLSMLGYGRELTEEAEDMVSHYVKYNEWEKKK